MSKEYSVGGNALTLATSAALTLVFVNPVAAPGPNIDIFRIWASQSQTATSAMFQVQVTTQVSAFPTLTSATPRQLKTGDAIASLITGATTGAQSTSGVNASAEGAGAKTVRWGDNFNNLNGYLWVATPREIFSLAANFLGGGGLYLATTPGAVAGWATGMNYGEGNP
jgi:hypothetical protein